ncbi:MAG: bacillithiol system redox-active protein YtxJ [Bacteroidetes bacterium]|nr:MAG: bacillithiol system redox-active protein YtxJ [Bacteroidota bacterium]
MNWKTLQTPADLEALLRDSHSRPQVIFKHSTTCSVSQMAKSRLERETPPEGIDFYYLDLLAYRPLSQQIATDLQVWHESPQVILVKAGACIYDESHMGIRMDDIVEAAA